MKWLRLQGENGQKSVTQLNSKNVQQKANMHLLYPVLKASRIIYQKGGQNRSGFDSFRNFTEFLIRGDAAPQYKSGNV